MNDPRPCYYDDAGKLMHRGGCGECQKNADIAAKLYPTFTMRTAPTTGAPMNCPHCGKPILSKLAAKALGAVKSERKAVSSANNGKLGGRPRKPR